MAGQAAQSPRVTVVTRTRNRPMLLTRALQSVGAQSFQDLELVIVNDAGSTESVDIALESAPQWLRERARVVTNKTSHGREAALEDGLAVSSCEFFAIHDDDDSWEPGFLAACVALAAVGVFLRSARRPPVPGSDLRVRALLLEDGGDSLGYFATRADRLTSFSPDGRAAVSFGVTMGVALAAGDPLGRRSSWEGAILAWLEECRDYGWIPAVISAGEEGARAYKEAGLSARRMGDEAIVKAADFDLRAHPAVAKAVRRVRSSGATVEVRRLGDIIHEEREQLRRAADDWRNGEERGFSMALDRTLADVDEREVVVTVKDVDGNPEALLGFSPWGMRGASLDVMRRSPTATNGVNEAMVTALLTEGPGMGIDVVSLNFAMFRSIFVDGLAVDASLTARALAKVMRLASRFWQLEQLYESNAKYGPTWSPRYMCFMDATQFVQVALAAGVLEGFVPVPRWWSLRNTSVSTDLTGEDYVRAVAEQGAEPAGTDGGTAGTASPAASGPIDPGTGRPRRFSYAPGLVVVDGGLPQVNAARAALDELGVDVPLIGLAKRLEEVWVPGEEFPVVLARTSPALHLLQHLRDESHRFAITHHRKKRSAGMTRSVLDGIPGLGPARQAALLREFGSVTRIRQADVDDITRVKGIGPALAGTILAHLNSPDTDQ